MFLRAFRLPLLWAALILVLSGIPGDYIPRVVMFSEWLGPDKLVHLVIFGVLAFLLLKSISRQYGKVLNRFIVVTIVLAVGTVFGLLLEALQRHVFVGRNGNPYDLAADVLGLILGTAVFYIFFERKNRHIQNN